MNPPARQAFFTFDAEADLYHASPLTRGPWDERFQHGGPPLALLTGALEAYEGAERFALTRVDATFQAAVPIAPLRLTVELVHGGSTVQHLRASLIHGERTVMTALGQRTLRRPTVRSKPPAPWREPSASEPWGFRFFIHEVGYHNAVEMRIAGGRWGETPIQMWARATVPLVHGRPTTPRQGAAIVADAQSGMGAPLDPAAWSFVNPQVTIAFGREPSSGWVGLDIVSMSGGEGAGLAQSLLRDHEGLFGGASQTLIFQPRA